MKHLLLLVCLAIPALAFSQQEDFRVEIHFQGNQFYHEFRPYEIVGNVGYNLTDRFFINVRGEGTIALFKRNGVKDYYTNYMGGANVGYTFLKNDVCNIDARIGLGDNLRRKQEWKYNYYDAGIYAHIGKAKVKPDIGFGIRRYHSKATAFKSYTRLFVAIGLSFGT